MPKARVISIEIVIVRPNFGLITAEETGKIQDKLCDLVEAEGFEVSVYIRASGMSSSTKAARD